MLHRHALVVDLQDVTTMAAHKAAEGGWSEAGTWVKGGLGKNKGGDSQSAGRGGTVAIQCLCKGKVTERQ